MSIDNDPEVYKLLIGGVMALLGILNGAGLLVLNWLKKAVDNLFARMREIEAKFAELKGAHDTNHREGRRK